VDKLSAREFSEGKKLNITTGRKNKTRGPGPSPGQGKGRASKTQNHAKKRNQPPAMQAAFINTWGGQFSVITPGQFSVVIYNIYL
jgi:hypothetical protein